MSKGGYVMYLCEYKMCCCIVPLLDYEKLLLPGLHSGWLSAHVYCEYDNVTSGIDCLFFFTDLRGRGVHACKMQKHHLYADDFENLFCH